MTGYTNNFNVIKKYDYWTIKTDYRFGLLYIQYVQIYNSSDMTN